MNLEHNKDAFWGELPHSRDVLGHFAAPIISGLSVFPPGFLFFLQTAARWLSPPENSNLTVGIIPTIAQLSNSYLHLIPTCDNVIYKHLF